MAYVKNNWVDREGTTRYFETVDDDGALILTPDYTQVTELGTPVNADNMNHIEEGIAAGSFTKYDNKTIYAKNDLVTTITDNELKVYKSLQDNNTNTLDNDSFWEEVEFTGGGGTGLQMFDTILKDHILTYEESKGLALQGTFVNKEAIAGSRYGYPDFYNKVVEEYNEASQEETINGVTVKVHSNGHKFYNIADKTAIDEFFNTMGLAWFYGVDIENERIFLPRNNYFEQATGDTTEVGLSVEAGLPNITGTFGGIEATGFNPKGAFADAGTGKITGAAVSGNAGDPRVSFDASRSNSIYGNSETVQPNAIKKLLYICVGNTTNYEGVTNVINQGMEILEQVNQGIETRVKLDGSNAQFPYIIETFSEGTSWYRVYSDGWCEQGGRAYEEASIVTLLKPYKDAKYNVVCNSLQTNSNTTNAINLKATQFEINTTSGSSSKVALWQACGYIA